MTENALPFGRFTAKGGDAVENLVTKAAQEVGILVAAEVQTSEMCCLIMLGGYGRGEGGVETRPDGTEVPHNNLDFLLICNNLTDQRLQEIKNRVDQLLQPLIAQYGLGMDLSTINKRKLESSECLVMWYDMRFGHKTILGDGAYLPSLTQFSLDKVVPTDARNLLTNRGTLLIINDAILERGDLTEDDRRTIIKHVVKGVIGYGDALLFFLGDYDWSYLEKQKRMKARTDVDANFKHLYDECMEFRFRPNYALYLQRDLTEWMNGIRTALAIVHLQVEQKRLGLPEVGWDDYAEYAISHTLFEIQGLKGLAKKCLFMLKGKSLTFGSLKAQLGFRSAGTHNIMPIIYPAVAYQNQSPYLSKAAKIALNAASTSQVDLRHAYLRAWGTYGDTNFAAVLKKLRLQI